MALKFRYLFKVPPKQSVFWIRRKWQNNPYVSTNQFNYNYKTFRFCIHDNVLQLNCTRLWFIFSLQIQNICSYLRNSTFFLCHVILDPAPFIKMCEEELCKCNLTDRLDCACSAFTQYSRACARNKAPIQWRTSDICRKCLLILYSNQLNMFSK